MPREQQDALLHEHEIHGLLKQSRISEKNVARLRTLVKSENERIAKLAIVVLDVALVAPYRRRRIRTLAGKRRDVLKRMEEAGLSLPQTVRGSSDPCDDDALLAWDEWVLFANGCA